MFGERVANEVSVAVGAKLLNRGIDFHGRISRGASEEPTKDTNFLNRVRANTRI